MDDVIEESIIKLFEDFKQNPEYFKLEDDLRYKFYDIITKKNNEYKFRWEYQTNMTYNGDIADENSKRHKKIDICFIKDDSSDLVPYSLEFKLLLTKRVSGIGEEDEFYSSKFKIIDPDFDELCERRNRIDVGYIIFFSFVKIIDDQDKKDAHVNNKKEFFKKYE